MIARSPSAVSKPCRPPPNSSPTRAMTAKPLRDWAGRTRNHGRHPTAQNRKVQYHYDKTVYRQRNIIERMFCRLKDWRRIATATSKTSSPQSPLPPPSSGGCNESGP